MKECKLVLTGFEPFGGSNINPSEILVKKFDGISINNGELPQPKGWGFLLH